MQYDIVEYHQGQRTVLETTDCPHDARAIKRHEADQWADPAEGMKSIRIETRAQ